MQKSHYFKILIIVIFLISSSLIVKTANSACVPGQEATGLITVGEDDNAISGTFGTTVDGLSPCVLDPSTIINPKVNRIPVDSYQSLKTIYFTKANPTETSTYTKTTLSCNPCTQNNIPMTIASTPDKDRLYNAPQDLNIGANIPGINNATGVIFVDGRLVINSNIISTANDRGLVFVVQGDVLINKTVTQVDAVLISEGTICSAAEPDLSCPTTLTTPDSNPLLIKGSLIALNTNNPIRFRRNLANNNQPAEKIEAQAKYLVILRNIFSSTWQKWTEIP